jgi:hypothetical protein
MITTNTPLSRRLEIALAWFLNENFTLPGGEIVAGMNFDTSRLPLAAIECEAVNAADDMPSSTGERDATVVLHLWVNCKDVTTNQADAWFSDMQWLLLDSPTATASINSDAGRAIAGIHLHDIIEEDQEMPTTDTVAEYKVRFRIPCVTVG